MPTEGPGRPSYGRAWRVLALAAGLLVLFAPSAVSSARAGSACLPKVTGGTEAERTAARRVLCGMPDSSVSKVELVTRMKRAPRNALGLRIVIDPSLEVPDHPSLLLVEQTRAAWEGALAAGAIRDGFTRLSLRRVVAFKTAYEGTSVGERPFRGLARREWGIPHWTVRPLPSYRRVADGTWDELSRELAQLGRRHRVGFRLERLSPFGKAPVVTVDAPRPVAFARTTGIRAFRRALAFDRQRYDGALLIVRSQGAAVYLAYTTRRPFPSGWCAVYHEGIRRSDVC